MAAVTSLGVHRPVGLPYLIREGILPQDPKSDLYQWETYTSNDGAVETKEEVLVAKHCVVWSQGDVIRAVYRFELEREDVVQAVLTRFVGGSNGLQGEERSSKVHSHDLRRRSGRPIHNGSQQPTRSKPSFPPTDDEGTRALVVLLQSKAQIFFLYGSHHIVDLPFRVERAFPAPYGLILQRKLSSPSDLPPTPKVPAPPQNSFFSSQLTAGSVFLQSPTLKRSLNNSQHTQPTSSSGGETILNELWQNLLNSPGKSEMLDTAALFTMTDPLSELGLLTESLQRQKLRLSAKSRPGASVEFDTLDAAERILYVSREDERQMKSIRGSRHGSLTLIVTLNIELDVLTIWHAWYLREKSLAEVMKQRAENTAEKARRRSSFLSASIGTGAVTPAVRNRDGARESFAAAPLATSTGPRRPPKQDEEAVMASQLDPDFDATDAQHTNKETNRRISSLVSRGELSTNDNRNVQTIVGSSFGGPGGRRNQSFGGPIERRSLGLRKSRGSTPGSVLSRSFGPEDDSMDLDSDTTSSTDENADEIVKHIRATFEANGAEGIFGTIGEGWRRDMVVRRIHSFSLGSSPLQPTADRFKVATLHAPQICTKLMDEELTLFIQDRLGQCVFHLGLDVKKRPLWPESIESSQVAIPLVKNYGKDQLQSDMLKLTADSVEVLLFSGRGLKFASASGVMCLLPASSPYRIYDRLAALSSSQEADHDIGRNRTLSPPQHPLGLSHSSPFGTYDEVGADRIHHRRRLKLRPHDKLMDSILKVCELVLPSDAASLIRPLWYTMYTGLLQQHGLLTQTTCSAEWVAIAATLFSLVLGLLDQKALAAVKISRMSTGKQRSASHSVLAMRQNQHAASILARPAWIALSEVAPSARPSKVTLGTPAKIDQAIPIALSLASEHGAIVKASSRQQNVAYATKLALALHILREEWKLNSYLGVASDHACLSPLIAQLGSWLGVKAWSFQSGSYYALEGGSETRWSFIKPRTASSASMEIMDTPIGVFEWLEHSIKHGSSEQYPSLTVVAQLSNEPELPTSVSEIALAMTPRIVTLSRILESTQGLSASPAATVEAMAKHGMNVEMLESLPEGVVAPFREAVARCEKNPPTQWSRELLHLVGREDLDRETQTASSASAALHSTLNVPNHDVQSICQSVDQQLQATKTREAGRNAVSQLIFSEDRRLVHAASLMHFNSVQIAECPKQPDWTDAFHFEQQRRVMQFVTIRMIALPAGDGMLHYDSQTPLMTEKYHLPGFNSSCIMHPMGHTVTTDRSGLTEDKVNWAYFHAGVSAGLRISRNAKGIDTSWVVFNKPNELTNRHAGLLLALGLSGHLRHLAKWLSFKYLTPKHTMTSVGLLLGLSASYLGSMDGLITRMLSVHITSMLPPGAAELNVSPLTQTAGLMGIGLLYYNTQHRRMSEIMLQEIEYMDIDDPDSGPDALRDESYRLAAGFALGLMNLASGKNLRGLHGMHLPERLLRIAVGPRPVHAVHVFDKATAGAIIATTLIYMKSQDASIARQIDVPDTEAQFEHVRPDMLMLRSMAKHVILWDTVEASSPESDGDAMAIWIPKNVPACCKHKWNELRSPRGVLNSSDVPYYYILSGLAWALSLKFAGSGNKSARNEILAIIDVFWALSKKRGDGYYFYDAKLARSSIRRCIDVLSLAAATVMAGTGDLQMLRYLRRLHGRTDVETPYGSHLAAHMGIGMLFLGGGTYSFGTSDFAVAALMISLYPLLPTDVHDNRVHLQAFRHLWVFAVEARCLVVEDIDTRRPIHMPIKVTLRNGVTKAMRAPCLLPELDSIATIITEDKSYWTVTLDFASNVEHLASFRVHQTIFVRRCPAAEAYDSVFWATIFARSEARGRQHASPAICSWLLSLPALRDLDQTDVELILPPDETSSVRTNSTGTKVDDRLVLHGNAQSYVRDRLWDLRVLFAWANRMTREGQGRMRWIGRDVVQALEFVIDNRKRALSNAS